MMAKQFESLVRLDEDELVSDEYEVFSDKESCKVPMIGSQSQAESETTVRHEEQNKINGLQFNINGRRIHVNPQQLRTLSLVTLTVQNAALNLTMRAARTQPDKFSTSEAVTVAEILKLITCIILVLYDEQTIGATIRTIKCKTIDDYMDTLKVAVPSLVYYLQNNLLYVGSTHLDAATCQVTYQLKILTTAMFSVVMLNKRLSKLQWISLFILFAGVALIETISVANHPSSKTGNSTDNSHSSHAIEKESPIFGFLAILLACCMSGFAGVYFEKILKGKANVSLWIRNIQLSALAIPIGMFQTLVIDWEHWTTKGFFYGFTPLTWLCIVLQVQGGLLVAVVVKFANNILKGFATSMAIVLSTVASMIFFDFNLTPMFVLGATLVIASVMMYNKQ